MGNGGSTPPSVQNKNKNKNKIDGKNKRHKQNQKFKTIFAKIILNKTTIMNIFVLDKNPEIAAKYHNNTHLAKMIVETCQLLCTTHHVLGNKNKIPYKKTHENHPCAKWVRESLSNYNWLLSLVIELEKEFNYRTGKQHKSSIVINWCKNNSFEISLPKTNLTEFVLVMPEECKIKGDAVLSYRNYYNKEKQGYKRNDKYIPYKWGIRDEPEWFERQ